MKISRTDSPTSSSQFKKSRNAYRPYEFSDLLKKKKDENLVTEEDEYSLRRYKKTKDGQLELLYEIKKRTGNQKGLCRELVKPIKSFQNKTKLINQKDYQLRIFYAFSRIAVGKIFTTPSTKSKVF